MRSRAQTWNVWLPALCALCACDRGAPRKPASAKPHVVEWKPGDELERLDQGLTLQFDRPMVDTEAVGPALEAPPLRVTPALPLRVHWEDPKTLQVQPEGEWKAGQRYTLQLQGALAAQVDEPRSFTFDAQPLRLRWLTLPNENVALRPQFDAVFNLAVKPEQAAEHCVLRSDDGKWAALGLRKRKPHDDAERERDPSRVQLEAREALQLHTHYVVECTGLTAANGNAPWRAEAKGDKPRGFTTHGVLALGHGWPAAGSAKAPELAELCLELTTPVKIEQLARHVHVSPAPEGLAGSWYEGRCGEVWVDTHRANSVLLAPRRHFVVTIDAELTDVFDQKLGHAARWEFDTGDRIPGLWTATGMAAVLEAGRKEHALGTLNLKQAELKCAELSPMQLATSFEHTSSWVGESADVAAGEREKAPWEALAITPHVHALEAAAAPNHARTIALDLGARCGAASERAGLYALELVPTAAQGGSEFQGDRPARLLANVTDLGVVAKRGESSALVWVTRLSNSALVADASVELIDASGHLEQSARTDARGLALFAHLQKPAEGEIFAVRAEHDLAIVGTHWSWREGLQPWQLGVREADSDSVRLFAHTDRGVYRPGERVLLHGLVREVSDIAPARVPAQRKVALTLSEGSETLLTRSLALSDFGSFSAKLDLPAHVAPGSLSLQIEVAGKTDTLPISVAEFRPLTFELTGGPAHDEVLAGERVQLDLSARYLFGAPLANAELHFTVERGPGQIEAPEFEAFRFDDESPSLPNEEAWPHAAEGILLERDQKSDAAGRAQLAFDAEASRRPTRYAITVAASDASKERATRSFSVLAHSAERYVGTRMTSWVFGTDEAIKAEVVLVDRAGHPVAGEVELELRDQRWDCHDPLTRCTAEVHVLEKQSVHVDADKPTLASFSARTSGEVHVRALTRDGAGRVARASDAAWIWSDAGAGPYDERVAATLSTDRRAYAIGDRARLALRSQLAPPHLLMTAERSDVLAADVVERSAGMPAIELGKAATPNVFVTLTGVTPRGAVGETGRPRLVAGAREVKVQGPSRVLVTQIALARDRYQPHERVEGDVVVTHLGFPVSAEVALVAVNESVLQLTAFKTPDPTLVFHAPRGLSVSTLSNYMRVIADPKKAAAVPKTARLGTPGEDGGAGRPELRDDYVAAAYFAPDLRTDRAGRVHFAFDAPTDLSAYRLMVVSAAKDDRVGSSAVRFTVAQPLSAHLLAPRFASRGDALEVGALVHDTTEQPGATAVQFAAKGLALDHSSAELEANPTGAVVRTRALVQDVDRASLEVELHKGAAADRVKHVLEVRRPLDIELRVLALGRAAKTRAKLDWPAGIDRELSRLEFTVDRAGLAPLAPVLASVIDYPYGCSEQTAAAVAAIAAAPELASAIMPGLAKPQQLHARIADGLGRLVQARAPDGQFGLYPGMSGRLWLTALVLETALAVQALNLPVPDALNAGAAAALSGWLKQQNLRALSPADLGLATHVALLLVRAGSAPDGTLDQLFAEREHLPVDGVARLLHAAALTQKPEAMRAELRATLRRTSWLTRERDPDDPLSSAERTTALALTALAVDGKEPELSSKLAHWLIARAADPEQYLSTRDVAETLTALALYARSASAGASQARIGLGTRVLWQGKLSGAQVVAITQPASASPAGDVWVEADAEISVSIRRRDVSPSAPKPAFAHGLSLIRRYLQPGSQRGLAEIALGDMVQVELELRNERPLRMVALVDPLPAGLEPLDPGLSSGRIAGCESCNDAAGFDHMRRHDDKVEAFAEWLPAGTHKLRYMLRATTPGAFSAPGASAVLMYMPDIFARSQVDKLAVKRPL
jgi:uncharacterized protein YfaS (alpha-2-macroglobulin family)